MLLLSEAKAPDSCTILVIFPVIIHKLKMLTILDLCQPRAGRLSRTQPESQLSVQHTFPAANHKSRRSWMFLGLFRIFKNYFFSREKRKGILSHKRQRTIKIGSHSTDENRRKDNLLVEGAESPSLACTSFGHCSELERRWGFPMGIFLTPEIFFRSR